MNKEFISIKQMQLFIFIYSIGSYLLFGRGSLAMQNAWISSIIAVLISIPVVLIYGRIVNRYPGKNFFDILEEVFGKIIGKIISILFILQSLFLCAYILNDFVDFIKITALFKTPTVVLMIFIGILSMWMIKEGIEVLAAWAQFFIRILLIFMVIMWIFLTPEMNIYNLQPIAHGNIKEIFSESVNLMTFPFTEILIFINFFDCVKTKNNVKNSFLKPLIISGVLCTIISMINLMILGPEGYSSFNYPGYEVIKRLKIQQEFQRVEIIVSTAFVIIEFLQINFCLLAVSKGVSKVFNLQSYKNIITPIIALLINLTYSIFKSSMESSEFSREYWTVYGMIFQVIFPIIIFIIILLKQRYYNKQPQ